MFKEIFRPSPYPKEIEKAIKRKPLELSESVVGRFFRNKAELADVQAVMKKMNEVQPLAIGLVGSRTEGRLAYSANQLAERLFYTYQQGPALGVSPEDIADSGWAGVLRGISSETTPLAEWLSRQSVEKVSLNDIKLEELPEQLQELVKIVPMVKMSAFSREALGNITMPQFPLPGALFPDIDVWAIVKGEAQQGVFDDTKSQIIVGSESGTFIQIHHLITYPGQKSESLQQAEKALEQFRPLR
jgi:hypothetical protein